MEITETLTCSSICQTESPLPCYPVTMAQQDRSERQGKLCGFDKDGSPVFTCGALELPQRCPRCGTSDATEPVEVTAMSNSRIVVGGLKWRTLSLKVPHCKPCSLVIEKAYSRRAILILPAVLFAVGVYEGTQRLVYAYLTFSVTVLATSLFVPQKSNQPKPGVSIRYAGEDRMVITSEHKGWLADLQIFNS